MSNLYENIRIAFTALFANKLRAVLTTIGIGIGIAAVIILVSMGNAAQAYINRQFLGTGADLITVTAGGGGAAGGGFGGRGETQSVRLSMRDVNTLNNPNNVPNILNVVPVLQVRTTTEAGVSTSTTAVTGTIPAWFDLQRRDIESGRAFDDNDSTSLARVAVLGQTTVATLFPDGSSPLGQSITINGIMFKVIGTLQSVGASGLGQDQDDIILVPLATAQSKLSTARNVTGDLPVSTIYLQVVDATQVQDLSTMTTDVLRTAHKLKPSEDNDFNVSNRQDALTSLSSVITTLTTFLAVIGGVSLLVGGIGVMNIMLVTVTERTREIGLRKAVGAKFTDILWQFLTESVVLCFVGGAAGLALSFIVVAIIGRLVSDLQPSVSGTSVVLATSVVTLVGIFFGLYPASRAAALSPIKALRTE